MLVVKNTYKIRCISDVIPPPLTSKLLKYIIERYGKGIIKEFTLRYTAFKPVQISILFLNNKAFYSRGDPLPSLVKGTVLNAWVSVAGDSISPFELDISGTYNTPYGIFDVELAEVEAIDLSKSGLGVGRYFKVDFVTPAVLTAKHMVPPPLRDKASKLPERHRLLPQPSFIFSYLLKLWNSIAEPDERIPGPGAGDWEAYKLGRLADVTLVEVDYRLRPETVVVGRDSRGRLRRVRGFTGWVVYECLSRRLLPIYDKLLALATYLGVGRSRGIGLGMVRVTGLSSNRPESSK